MKVAFLVYKPIIEGRRKNQSFDGLSNIGCYMLIDVLAKNNIIVDFCSVDSAHKYDIVMVSFTSIYDILAYYKQVARHKNFKKPRKFKIIGGGFGMQNPIAISEYLDYAWFGRCENEIYDIIKSNLEFEHPSLMNLKNIKNVFINQVTNLYNKEIILRTNDATHNKYKENMLGCHNKCFFCHYTFARNHVKINNSSDYFVSSYSQGQELDMFNIKHFNPNIQNATVGMDGISEELRYFVNKRISNELVANFILDISNLSIDKNKTFLLRLYNITGYEIETENDYNEFKELLHSIENKLQKRIVLVLQNTPLHPSPLTPIAYSKINLFNKLNTMVGQKIIPPTKNLHPVISQFQESNFRLLESLVIERFTEKHDELLYNITFNNSLNKYKSNDKIKALSYKFDLTDLTREYKTNEQLPTWFLNSYISNDKIKKMRELQINKYIRPVNNSIEIK